MLTIGYVRHDEALEHRDVSELEAAGCQVVRTEASGAGREVLASILEFIGDGDQLVVTGLDRLAASGHGLLDTLDRLEARGASLRVLAPAFDSQGASGRALRAVLEALAGFEPRDTNRTQRVSAATQDILNLYRSGHGPVEIARRLGVSRMTVWRKLKALASTRV